MKRAASTIQVNALWHNAFSKTVGGDSDIQARLKMLLANTRNVNAAMTIANAVTLGISEGDQLMSAAAALGIPVNIGFRDHLVSVEGTRNRPVEVGDLRLHVIGPNMKNLDTLKKDWLAWLHKHQDGHFATNASLAAKADSSIPNLSSIMVLAETQDKRVLLAGDGRSDHLIQGLHQANMLDSNGNLHVDILKVPHHGSARNVTSQFFKTVTADKYIISANGKDGNPDLDTLIWIVEAAKEQGRSIKILSTNETPSILQLTKKYKPDDYNYQLSEMSKTSDSDTANCRLGQTKG